MCEADCTIAGLLTFGDWRKFRNKLSVGTDSASWSSAFTEYFRPRIELRYLKPIRILQDHDTKKGEGFAIVAIHCTLVERVS